MRRHWRSLLVPSLVACGSLVNWEQRVTVRAQEPRRAVDVHDGFEESELSDLWETSRFVPGTVVLEKSIKRGGDQAVQITVRSGDLWAKGLNGNSDNERSELLEVRSLVARQGEAFEQRFSLFFPADFPIVPTRLVLAQWKQYCPAQSGPCSDDSPVLALRYSSGALSVTQDLESKHTVTLWSRRIDVRGRWLDFRTQTRFRPDAKGHLKLWLNREPIVDYRGRTAYFENAASGYSADGYFYFKMGLYRNAMREPMTVYIDEYGKRTLNDAGF